MRRSDHIARFQIPESELLPLDLKGTQVRVCKRYPTARAR